MSLTPSVRPARLLTAVLVGCGLLAGACSGGEPTPSPSATNSSATPSATPTPTPRPKPAGSFFSGRLEKDGRVLAVKLDNTPASNPHAGVKDADVVYVEEVEYGVTRYAAIYSTRVPKVIGPIRSARVSDIDLLKQYGRVAFAYSGASSKMRRLLAQQDFYDVSGDKGPTGYWRQSGRSAPYNFFGDGQRLLARAPNAEPAKDIGLRFSATPPAGGRPATTAKVSWPSTTMGLTWSPTEKRYLVTTFGRKWMATEGGQLGGTTVIIQYCKQYDSGFGDKFGGRTPFIETVGTGRAVVLRDGKAYDVTWARAKAGRGTTYLLNGKILPLAPGQVWVLLVRKERPATIG